MEEIKTNSVKAWLLASRPKTLAAAAAPVIVGIGIAIYQNGFKLVPALICLIFALLMQVAANLINDLIDYFKGADDEDRLGPQRATSQGWITPHAMKWGIVTVVGIACLLGLLVIYYSTWKMIFIGLACVIFAYLYTSGPYPLSYNGLGDIAVVVFFGIVPVTFTCYVQTLQIEWIQILLGVSVGLVVNTLLVVNNYRDRDTDAKNSKRTIIVKLGEPFGRYFYLACGLIAALVALITFFYNQIYWPTLLLVLYLIMHVKVWRTLCIIRSGSGLNKLIGASSGNMLIFSILSTIILWMSK